MKELPRRGELGNQEIKKWLCIDSKTWGKLLPSAFIRRFGLARKPGKLLTGGNGCARRRRA